MGHSRKKKIHKIVTKRALVSGRRNKLIFLFTSRCGSISITNLFPHSFIILYLTSSYPRFVQSHLQHGTALSSGLLSMSRCTYVCMCSVFRHIYQETMDNQAIKAFRAGDCRNLMNNSI